MGENKIEVMTKDEWKKSSKKEKKKSYKSTIITLLIFIFFIGISVSVFTNYNKIVMEITRVKAIKYSEKEVEKYLKSPSTAKFPNFIFDSEDLKTKLHSEDDGYTWVVGGYVDSQNYMGAMVRSTWAVGIKFSKDGKQYEILNVDIK